jgi:glucose-1-phosphate thymidylyltransferase
VRGIVLAGGLGTRLGGLTAVTNKHLLPVYDRPMILYPLLTLRSIGVTQIVIITRPEDTGAFFRLLVQHPELEGLALSFMTQRNPRGGIAEALLIGADFTSYPRADPVALILGDNLFMGDGLAPLAAPVARGARVFVCEVGNATEYGVLRVEAGRPVSIEEKPMQSGPRLAVTGLYLFDGRAREIANALQPSARGELEIVDVLRWYLERGELEHCILPPTVSWTDLGTPDRLLDASVAVRRAGRLRRLAV